MTELSGLQIFKYLPAAKKAEHTNCKECGCPTCMAFALKLAKHNIDIEKCHYVPEDLKNIYEQTSKEPQKTVEINGLKIGGENVLYRHEKTFINPCAISIIIDLAKPNWQETLKQVKSFEITRINEHLKIDLVIIKETQNKKIKDFESIILDGKLNVISYDEFMKLPLKGIIDKSFTETAEELVKIREKAVIEKDENYSNPVYVYFEHTNDLNLLCAKASYYICKYANMLILEDFNPYLITSLMTLRQNIFTDPQKPLQVEPKIYEFNNPDENSLIFMTTNFALTFFAVANELESLPVPSYLVVTPAEGMSVLTAWSAEKFTAKTAARTLKKFDLANKVKNRKIIIPGLLAHMKDELQEEIKDFEIVVGTVEAFAIGDFVKNMKINQE